ncbi:calcium/proton exchanger [Candidatus Amarolinea aalborgensis]|jgi:Ca2+:H+ antiporter|uniref:calcium/proton exchanger n=1 Tax=Candidatus Amarolinea aalborgensis TaxID=2249329 RepID=UPI003BF9ED2D
MKYLSVLLVFVPLAILGALLHWSPLLVFAVSALGVVPLAGLLGEATEHLVVHTGPRVGGLLNATLGNAAELIITIFALRAGLFDLVKASITGSIIGNMLLIMGFSMVVGGLKHGRQHFNRSLAGVNATQLLLATAALAIPSLFSFSTDRAHPLSVDALSLWVAVVMIVIYLFGILFSFRQEDDSKDHQSHSQHSGPVWSVRKSLTVLAVSTVFIAWLSEILVGAVEPTVAALGVSEFFLGIIVIPLVGNIAEHLVAVQVALKNKMDLSLGISIGSSLQIALFVAPLLVFISLLFGRELTLVFNPFEIIALFAAALIAAFVSLDGESNWLEGAQLLALYAIVALAFFFLP